MLDKRSGAVTAAVFVLLALLACRQSQSEDDESDGERAERGTPAKADSKPHRFVRERPIEPAGVDACGFTGGLGMACLDALLAEKNPVARRLMRRLSDAHAHLDAEAVRGGEFGPPHAELAMLCQSSGPCGGTNAEGATLDDGYACLTAAEANRSEPSQMKAFHERACRCGSERAQIPVMGGTLACDGPGKPVERGASLSRAEATDADACGRCDSDTGPAACEAEIRRLRPRDRALADYLEQVHVPRCEQK